MFKFVPRFKLQLPLAQILNVCTISLTLDRNSAYNFFQLLHLTLGQLDLLTVLDHPFFLLGTGDRDNNTQTIPPAQCSDPSNRNLRNGASLLLR